MSRYRSDHMHFVNALREVIGLAPIGEGADCRTDTARFAGMQRDGGRFFDERGWRETAGRKPSMS